MPLILRKSSIIQINHMLKKPNNRIYVSDLVINENVVHPFHFKKNEIQIIIAIIKMNSHHHIVGVPALCQWSFVYIGESSPVTEASRIFCPALRFFKIRIYKGYKIIAKKNAPSENKIIWFNFISITKNTN